MRLPNCFTASREFAFPYINKSVSYTHLDVYKRQGKSGRSLAVYIKAAALAATVTARHTPEENALRRSLAGMANNLNQQTKLLYQTGFYKTRLLIDGLQES